jgi:hypothetical protein
MQVNTVHVGLSIAKSHYVVEYFKIKFLNLSNLFGPLQYYLISHVRFPFAFSLLLITSINRTCHNQCSGRLGDLSSGGRFHEQ